MRKYLSPEEIKKMSLSEMLEFQRPALEPEYTLSNTKITNSLFYSWHGFASGDSTFSENAENIARSCVPEWKNDGFDLLKFNLKPKLIQILCGVVPTTPPVEFARKMKGRLDHAFRKSGNPTRFSRAVGFRSLGGNTSKIVSRYIAGQVAKEDLVDERFRLVLSEFTRSADDVKLSDAMNTNRGRYWFNLHIVLVAGERNIRISKDETFEKITTLLPRIAAKNGCELSDHSIMPDHIHIALKGNPKMSPVDIGLSFLNNLWYMLNLGAVWKREFYVGTFSEYSLREIGIR
ncbi:MAG: hypothetical protein GXP32_06715 [Kiritimatiellaeota bacterium]|nr:hypothetical protein [Kiritimatiellota bacterium]